MINDRKQIFRIDGQGLGVRDVKFSLDSCGHGPGDLAESGDENEHQLPLSGPQRPTVGEQIMYKERKRKWTRSAIVACVLLVVAVFAAFKWEDGFRALIYHRPVRYDEPFGPAIAGADRIVVRADGFDCCGPVDEENILFIVTEPDQSVWWDTETAH